MKNRNSLFRIILIVLIAFLGGYFFGVNNVNLAWQNYKPSLNVINKEPPSGTTTVDFSPFWTVWQNLMANYYDKSKLNQQKMLNGAIEGMVQSLGDPFTLYLPPAQNSDFKQGLAGEFSGIGSELGMQGKDIIIMSPLDGSPSIKAGIKAGDIITQVDGQSTAGWSLTEAVDKIRGPKGSVVTLTVVHKDSQTPVDIKITRDIITVPSVTMDIRNAKCDSKGCTVLDKGTACSGTGCQEFAYIRLSQFGDNTNQEWENLVKGISAKINQNKNIKGVVLDLRNNPGGYLTDATFIASEFLPEGDVVVTEDNTIAQNPMYVTRNGLLLSPKLVVLINKGSASASEIVAGSLRDHKRAILVGETSYGKGTVQEAEDLGGGAGLHVTIAKWLTPNGTWVNGKGLTPDVPVAFNPKNATDDNQLDKAVFELVK